GRRSGFVPYRLHRPPRSYCAGGGRAASRGDPVSLAQGTLTLCLVTDRSFLRGTSLSDVVAAAVRGGVTSVQLREKEADGREFLELALALKALLGPSGVPLYVNDRVDIALAAEADGVHLGQSDLPTRAARE